MDDPQVAEGLSELWEGSKPSAPMLERVEQYGWIVKTDAGYRVHRIGSGNVCGATFDFSVEPPEGYGAVVGWVHTHPYTVGENIISCDANGNVSGYGPYPGTPSDPDRQASIDLGKALGRAEPLSGFAIDANQIHGFNGFDTDRDVHIARCGY